MKITIEMKEDCEFIDNLVDAMGRIKEKVDEGYVEGSDTECYWRLTK